MSKIQIITIATGGYKNYVPPFLDSIRHFFPDDEKYITIFSDGLPEYNYFSNEYIKRIKIEKLHNFLYPCINLNKPVLINDVLSDVDYTVMIDIDTIFMNRPEYDWSILKKYMDNDEVLLTQHPFYSLKPDAEFWGDAPFRWINNLYTLNLTEKDSKYAAYIKDQTYTYINSAFWAANVKTMKKFNDEIIELARKDLTRYPNGYHIPKYMDENYVNKLANEYQHGKGDLKFCIMQFSNLYNTESIVSDFVFMYQKNMKDFKYNRQ